MKKIILGKKYDVVTDNNVEERKTKQMDRSDQTQRVELIDKRTIYEKHYMNNDGNFTMELSSQPIHYYDAKSSKYEEIDNSLIEEDNYLKVKGNDFSLMFAKETSNERLLKLIKDNKEISLKFKGKTDLVNRTFKSSKARYNSSEKLNTTLVYDDVVLDTDLEYKVSSNQIKENIIIKKRQEKYEYEFEMNINDLQPQLSKDEKTIELVDLIDNQVKFVIPSPIMYDANNSRSYDVSYEFEVKSEGILSLLIKASSEWINNNERLFPVYIDPQIIAPAIATPLFKIYEIKPGAQTDITSRPGEVDITNIVKKNRLQYTCICYECLYYK